MHYDMMSPLVPKETGDLEGKDINWKALYVIVSLELSRSLRGHRQECLDDKMKTYVIHN